MKEVINLINNIKGNGNKTILDLQDFLWNDKSYFVASAKPLNCDYIIAKGNNIIILVIESGFDDEWLMDESYSDDEPPMWISSLGKQILSPIFRLRHAKRLIYLSMIKEGITVEIGLVLLVYGEILDLSSNYKDCLSVDMIWHNLFDKQNDAINYFNLPFNATPKSPVYKKIKSVIASCTNDKIKRKLFTSLPENDEDICEPGSLLRMCEDRKPTMNIDSDVFKELDNLLGLEELKSKMRKTAAFLAYNNQVGGRHNDSVHLHAMFLGNPGTGKTTVASLYARMLHGLGLLPGEVLKVISRNDIIGELYGSIEKNLNNIVDELEGQSGGVLFVDEAYTLAPPDDMRDPGWESISCFMRIMDTHPSIVLVFAGYEQEMRSFIDHNPGFKSRLHNNVFLFPDFSETELIRMVEGVITGKEYTLEEEAHKRIEAHIHAVCSCRDKYFGNGRFARTLADEIFQKHAMRIIDGGITDEKLVMTISGSDIPEYKPSVVVKERRIGFSA